MLRGQLERADLPAVSNGIHPGHDPRPGSLDILSVSPHANDHPRSVRCGDWDRADSFVFETGTLLAEQAGRVFFILHFLSVHWYFCNVGV